jgi:hypothetical protein
MRAVADKMYYGDYKFLVELDTGAETGTNQVTVWVAEKISIDSVSLVEFRIEQLLKALAEPLQSLLRARLEEEKYRYRKPFKDEIVKLQDAFQPKKEQKRKQLPHKVRRQIRTLYQVAFRVV